MSDFDLGQTTRHQSGWSCPHCGYRMDSSSPVDGSDAVPGDGDFSMCMACGALAVYTFGGRAVRPPTAEESEAAWQDLDLVRTWQAVQLARSTRADWPKGTGGAEAP